MSSKNNINPGHYKVGGRDKPDDQARARMKGGRAQAPKNVSTPRKAQPRTTKKKGAP